MKDLYHERTPIIGLCGYSTMPELYTLRARNPVARH
jgi:hypothetical protein